MFTKLSSSEQGMEGTFRKIYHPLHPLADL